MKKTLLPCKEYNHNGILKVEYKRRNGKKHGGYRTHSEGLIESRLVAINQIHVCSPSSYHKIPILKSASYFTSDKKYGMEVDYASTSLGALTGPANREIYSTAMKKLQIEKPAQKISKKQHDNNIPYRTTNPPTRLHMRVVALKYYYMNCVDKNVEINKGNGDEIALAHNYDAVSSGKKLQGYFKELVLRGDKPRISCEKLGYKQSKDRRILYIKQAIVELAANIEAQKTAQASLRKLDN